jgi:hypothetical protein
MACPFFDPATPFSWGQWPDAPRMPLGDPYTGVCTASPIPVPDARLRTCCNAGYARGVCPTFPAGDAGDAVRFGILRRESGLVTIQYVVERDHHPLNHGTLVVQEREAEVREAQRPSEGRRVDSLLERQARAYLDSYLRRTV